MHILFLADAVFEDLPGGSRVVAREAAKHLACRGHRVTFLVGRRSQSPEGEKWHDGIRIVRYDGVGQCHEYLRRGAEACAKIWEETPFDLVHTHFAYAAVGPLHAVPKFVPRVRTFHGPWDEEGWIEDMAYAPSPIGRVKAHLKKHLRRLVETTNLRGSDTVLTLSDCFRAQVITRFGIPANSVHTIPGGTDVERFTPSTDRQAVRRRLDLPPHRRLLLSIRRLCPRMGLDNLITAMPAVIARHPDMLLLIGGHGPERERLERLIRELHLENSVRLIGFLPDDLLASYYQAADLFVLPTAALEGFGLVTTEALACGTPVIGTHVGATPEILQHVNPRWIVPGTSPEALAGAILNFWQHDLAPEHSPARLHEYVCCRYTWDGHVQQLEAIYADALAQSHRSAADRKSAEESLAFFCRNHQS